MIFLIICTQRFKGYVTDCINHPFISYYF